jgi:hypothetical protein
METYQFCINNDCRIACDASSEHSAWQWLAETKNLTVDSVKKLYKIKLKQYDKRTIIHS